MRSLNKYVRTSSHSDELTGDFGNKPEAILIGDHFLSCLLAEKLSLRDLRLLQQYRHLADIPRLQSRVRFWKQSGHWRTVLISLNFSVRVSALDAATRDNPSPALRRTHGIEHYPGAAPRNVMLTHPRLPASSLLRA